MSQLKLDLHDIQGNIVKAYGRYGFPKGRYVFFAVCERLPARQFVEALVPYVTTSSPWRERGAQSGSPVPEVTTNIAFSYHGLRELGVPRASLQTFPDEFAMGMKARRDILGDDGASAPERWDPIWQLPDPIDIFVAIHGQEESCLERRYQEILTLVQHSHGGVKQLTGHRGEGGRDDLPYQAASAIYIDGVPSPKEHFGYTDGISDPFFKGTGAHESNLVGGGKVTHLRPETRLGWEALETGEFLLGYKDEALELPEAPSPKLLSQNGTFMVYRKLHENVGSFDAYLDHVGAEYPGGRRRSRPSSRGAGATALRSRAFPASRTRTSSRRSGRQPSWRSRSPRTRRSASATRRISRS